MIARQDKKFYVSDIEANENKAVVTCKPGINVRKHIEIGQCITTADFNLVFKGCESKWKIIFYPKGQYDFGIPSNDQRFYFMLASCEEATVKMKIQASVNMKSSQSYNVKTVSSKVSESVFIRYDKLRNWTGPLVVNASDNKSSEIESVTCTFRPITNEMNERKRDLREADIQLADNLLTSSSKKSRSVSSSAAKDQKISTEDHSQMEVDDQVESSPGPSTRRLTFPSGFLVTTSQNPPDFQLADNLLTSSSKKSRSVSSSAAKDQKTSTESHSPMEVDDQIESSPGPSTSRSKFTMKTKVGTSTNLPLPESNSPEVFDVSLEQSLRNPFTTKSPLLFNRLTQPSHNRNTVAERWVSPRRGDFKFKRPSSRTIIFSPEEREKVRSSCRKMSLSRSDDVSSENVQSSQFKSSGCLKQSDLVRTKEAHPDNQSTQSGSGDKCETNASEENTLLTSDDDDDDSIEEAKRQVRRKMRYFENKFKK